MKIWPLVRDLATRLDIQGLSIPKNKKEYQHRIEERKKELQRRKKRKIFPFLDLPLELRLQIYRYAISNKQHNITCHKWRNGGRVLPSLFHTHPQITREIYQFCFINAVINVWVPKLPRSLSNQSGRRWLSITIFKDLGYFFHACWAVSRMLVANHAVEGFHRMEGRRGLVVRVRVRCLGCTKGCKGLRGDPVCLTSYRFANSDSWEFNKALTLMRGDILFEFC